MKKLTAIAIVCIACNAASSADAALQVGDRIRFYDKEGTTGGGEFGITKFNEASPFPDNAAHRVESAELFRTFCIEKNEFVDFQRYGFVIDSISKSAVNGGANVSGTGGNPDPIGAATAWLYYNFHQGTLGGYDYLTAAGRVASANTLQNAIWGFEDEIAKNLAWTTNPFVIAANAAVLANGADVATAVARTFVLNIVWATDRGGFEGVYDTNGNKAVSLAQSQLYVIPEASTIAVWSILSLVGAAAAYRQTR